MSSTHNFFYVLDRKQDLEIIAELITITNIGIEAITHIYDDHSLDKNVSTKMFPLQENLKYRIFAAFHQYELLIDGINSKSVIDLNSVPYDGNLYTHPTIYKYNNELSSIVDSIFFHLCSVFDYLGHFISYMFEKNKDKTLDWGALANKARAAYKEKLKSADCIRKIDNNIRIKLEEHRSQLIHKKPDLRGLGITKHQESNQLSLKFATSQETIKHFKNIIPVYDKESKYTLEFLPSVVIHRTLRSINVLLDFLRFDLLSDSAFEENVKYSKNNGFPYLEQRDTNKLYPKSEVIWLDYICRLDKFYQDSAQLRNKTRVG
uniref:hypothetical protein n=1 Tax=Pedobacter schmidteae TaxID=2201271 RepID=UPI000EB42645|nr:hypothetical protein [Pedobacter schmidteae]